MKTTQNRLLGAALAAPLALGAAPALAQDAPAAADVRSGSDGVVEVSGFVGWHIFTDRNDLGEPDSLDSLIDDAGLFGLRVGYYLMDRVQLGGELVIIPTDSRGDDADDTSVFGYRLNVQYDFAEIPELGGTLSAIAGIGGLTASKSDKSDGMGGGVDAGSIIAPHLGLAAKVEVGDGWGLRFDGRAFLVPENSLGDDGADDGLWDFEATAGIYKHFGAAKQAAAPAPEEPPPAPADRDGDGVPDDQDGAPDDAEDKDDFEDADGVPDPDNDKDGVGDQDDKCPLEAEDKDGFADEDGCPEADNDGDGLPDGDDKCPNEAEDKDGFQDEDGCPDDDNDGDGVSDAADKCPDQLESKNGYQDGDGCHDEVPKEVAKYTGAIKGIQFDTGKATIKKASNKTLDAAVKVMTDFPDMKIEIQGHTDDVGDAESNRVLSQQRAEAVKAYFEAKGIAPERLRAVGFGPDQPVDPAKTAKARAKNRRVEFKLIGE